MGSSNEPELDRIDLQRAIAYAILKDAVGIRVVRDENGELALRLNPDREPHLHQFFPEFDDRSEDDPASQAVPEWLGLYDMIKQDIHARTVQKDLTDHGRNSSLWAIADIICYANYLARSVGRPPDPPNVVEGKNASYALSFFKLRVVLEHERKRTVSWAEVARIAFQRELAKKGHAPSVKAQENQSNIGDMEDRISEHKLRYLDYLIENGRHAPPLVGANSRIYRASSLKSLVIDWEPSEAEMDGVPEWNTKMHDLIAAEKADRIEHLRSKKR